MRQSVKDKIKESFNASLAIIYLTLAVSVVVAPMLYLLNQQFCGILGSIAFLLAIEFIVCIGSILNIAWSQPAENSPKTENK